MTKTIMDLFFKSYGSEEWYYLKISSSNTEVIWLVCLRQWIQLADYALHNKLLLRQGYGITASNSAVRLPPCPVPEQEMM